MKPDLIDFAIVNSALVRPISYAKKWIEPSIRLSFLLIKIGGFPNCRQKH